MDNLFLFPDEKNVFKIIGKRSLKARINGKSSLSIFLFSDENYLYS